LRTLYGIKNCDSCRNAVRWLEENGISFRFHDLREDGLDIQMLERWSGRIDWHKLLNTRSATWRQMPAKDRENMTKSRAFAAMIKHPTLVKRPVLEGKEFIAVGFKPESYRASFARVGIV